MLTTLFSYLSTPIYADAAAEESKSDEGKNEKSQEEVESKEEDSDDSEKKDDEGKEGKEEEPAEEEEEEEEDEPEDPQPVLREECQNSAKCTPLKQHFEHCQEKIHNGQGYKGEDCVEEMFHMMHCADECAGPRLFAKLR